MIVIKLAGKNFQLVMQEAGCLHMICADCGTPVACTHFDTWEQAKHYATVHATAAIN